MNYTQMLNICKEFIEAIKSHPNKLECLGMVVQMLELAKSGIQDTSSGLEEMLLNHFSAFSSNDCQGLFSNLSQELIPRTCAASGRPMGKWLKSSVEHALPQTLLQRTTRDNCCGFKIEATTESIIPVR